MECGATARRKLPYPHPSHPFRYTQTPVIWVDRSGRRILQKSNVEHIVQFDSQIYVHVYVHFTYIVQEPR